MKAECNLRENNTTQNNSSPEILVNEKEQYVFLNTSLPDCLSAGDFQKLYQLQIVKYHRPLLAKLLFHSAVNGSRAHNIPPVYVFPFLPGYRIKSLPNVTRRSERGKVESIKNERAR